MSIVFGTGHRPEDYEISFQNMVRLCIGAIGEHGQVDVVVTGMAAGFDLAWGWAGYVTGTDVWTVRPWAGHTPRRGDEEYYNAIEGYATRHIITNDSLSYPGPFVYHVRNQWMVDNSDEGFAYWNGKESGGTFACLQYAESKNVPVRNLYG